MDVAIHVAQSSLSAGLDKLIELAEAGDAAAKLASTKPASSVGGDDEFEYGEEGSRIRQILIFFDVWLMPLILLLLVLAIALGSILGGRQG